MGYGCKVPLKAYFSCSLLGIWQIHPFREGNTRTVALFAIKYLRSLGYQASNDLFAEKSWYFRNALVRANYENVRLQIEKTQLPLEEFFVDCCSYIRGVTYSKSQEIHDSIDGWKVLRANNIVLGSYKVNYDDVKITPFIKKDIV